METFDLASLFSKMGGNAAVVSRLNSFFTSVNDGTGSRYAYMGNEPSLTSPWGYDWAGDHRRHAERRSPYPRRNSITNTPCWPPWQ